MELRPYLVLKNSFISIISIIRFYLGGNGFEFIKTKYEQFWIVS